MIVEQSLEKTRKTIRGWRKQGESVGLVPTMGYFHDGHLQLMKTSVRRTDKTIVSLFVNPTQFGSGEDLEVYPTDFEGDCEKAGNIDVDLLFCPNSTEVYRLGHKTVVTVVDLTQGLCGVDRPVHFTGVATVVSKLFNMIRPDYAFFGEKDFQQLRVIQQLADDLNFEVSIVGVPIVREADGLAMSSRNAYLSSSERKEALVLYKALTLIRDEALDPNRNNKSAELLQLGKSLIGDSSICTIDYLSIVDELTLQPQPDVKDRCRVLGAIRVNERIRLIDNLPLYE